MPRFTVTSGDAGLFTAANLTANHSVVPVNSVVDGDFVTPGDVWLSVTVVSVPGAPLSNPATGFMREADLDLIADLPPEPVLDKDAFCALVNNAARTRGIDRDYLMAVAWAGTSGLTQLGVAGGRTIGPFRFTVDAWAKAIADPQAGGLGLTPVDRRRWRLQVEMAGVLTRQLNDRLTTALGKAPILGEIYFAHVFGIDAGAALLAGDRGRAFQDVYTQAIGAAAYATLLAEDAALVTDAGAARSIGGVLDQVSRRLDIGYRDAAQVIDQQEDDIRFFHAEAGDPPWLKVAREEQFRGVYEFNGADNNARISEYHQVAGTSGTADDVPWCGAFMAFCMLRSGNAHAAASVLSGSATAARWLSWGEAAPAGEQPAGTIVVLKPQAAGSTGHVGMLVEAVAAGRGAPADKIRLLAGNQGTPQRVCTLDFDAGQVAANGYRRLPGAAPVAVPVPAPAGATFGSLVPGGFFSAVPTNLAIKRSIRTNNPGALNFSSWQAARKGFVGKSQPDATINHNVTTIYRTPEHGVASWYHLLSVKYGFAAAGSFSIRTLAQRYSGQATGSFVDHYVISWVALSGGTLTPTSVIDIANDGAMLGLAKAMFQNEAGVATPVHDDQILFAIHQERAGTLPA